MFFSLIKKEKISILLIWKKNIKKCNQVKIISSFFALFFLPLELLNKWKYLS